MPEMKDVRVVITGVSCISSLGITQEELITNLIGKKINLYNDQANKLYNLGYCNREQTTLYDTHNGLQANALTYLIKIALKDSGLTDNFLQDIGIIEVLLGSTFGNKPDLYEMHSVMRENADCPTEIDINGIPEGLKEMFNMQYSEDQLFGALEDNLPFKIRAHSFQAQCISGIIALLYGANLIRTGKCGVVLAGAYDMVDLMPYFAMKENKLISENFSMPYNKSNSGMSFADGGGVFVLENYEHARKRNATNFYGEIKGGSITSKPDGIVGATIKSIISTIDETVKSSKLDGEDIDFISPHGMGNNEMDSKELYALKQYFKERTKQIPIVTYVANLGYSLAGSGMLDIIIAMDCMNKNRVIGTISPDNPHEEFDYHYGHGNNFEHHINNILKIKANVAGEAAGLIISKI